MRPACWREVRQTSSTPGCFDSKSDEFLARVTARADDRDLFHSLHEGKRLKSPFGKRKRSFMPKARPLSPHGVYHFCLTALILIVGITGIFAASLQINDAQALAAGKRLWHNECAGTVDGLTSWNTGEDFASLGIGHYIWYPAGPAWSVRGKFSRTGAVIWRAAGVPLPDWLRTAKACPWNTREEFLRDHNGGQADRALREVLAPER